MEQAMIDICEDENGKSGFEVYSFTARSFNDVSFATIFLDIWKMLGGYVIMFFYTVFMLGRVNKREVVRECENAIMMFPILDPSVSGWFWYSGLHPGPGSLTRPLLYVRT